MPPASRGGRHGGKWSGPILDFAQNEHGSAVIKPVIELFCAGDGKNFRGGASRRGFFARRNGPGSVAGAFLAGLYAGTAAAKQSWTGRIQQRMKPACRSRRVIPRAPRRHAVGCCRRIPSGCCPRSQSVPSSGVIYWRGRCGAKSRFISESRFAIPALSIPRIFFSRGPVWRLIRPLSVDAAMKIVLAYSGGLDTSVLLSWLREKYQAEVIAFCANIGQEEELEGLEKKARSTGASKVYIDDLREEFARDFIFPMMQAAAIYEHHDFP